MLSLYDPNTQLFEVHHLVNATHDLLQRQRRNMRLRDELENRSDFHFASARLFHFQSHCTETCGLLLHCVVKTLYRQYRTEADITHLHSAQDKLKETLEKNKRELAQMQEKERRLQEKNRQLTVKVKGQQEEVSTITARTSVALVMAYKVRTVMTLCTVRTHCVHKA